MVIIKPTPLNLDRLDQAFLRSWSQATCWPNCWDKDNPATGHCRVSSVVAQALIGGNIYFARVDRGTHYWNDYRDFTREQFPPEVQIPEGVVVDRDIVMSSENIVVAYPILMGRMINALGLL